MNIHDVVRKARRLDQAIGHPRWQEDQYLQHGMDNCLRWPDGRIMNFSIADLLNEEYMTIKGKPYQP